MLQWDKVPLVPSPRTQELISPAKGSGFEINLQNNHKLPHFARPSVTSKPVRYKAKRDFTHIARCCFSYTNKRNQGVTREQFPKASKRAAAPLKQPIKKKKKRRGGGTGWHGGAQDRGRPAVLGRRPPGGGGSGLHLLGRPRRVGRPEGNGAPRQLLFTSPPSASLRAREAEPRLSGMRRNRFLKEAPGGIFHLFNL